MIDSNTTANLDRIFDALGNEHRREIIYALSMQPYSISKLAERRALSLPAIYKHIKILEKADLILRKKIGRTNFLAINRDGLLKLQEWVMQFHAYWGSNMESLENYKEYLDR